MRRWEGGSEVAWYYSFSNYILCELAKLCMLKIWSYFFEINNIMFEPILSVFIDACGVGHQYKKLRWHKIDNVKCS